MASPASNKRKRSSEPEEAPSRVTIATNAPTTIADEERLPLDQPPLPSEAPPTDIASEDGEVSEGEETVPTSTLQQQPPLPTEDVPPLPSEPIPQQVPNDDDGWQPIWDGTAQAYYFYNRFTRASQWDNPRVLNSTASHMPTHQDRIGNIMAPSDTPIELSIKSAALGGYNPAVHGDYDPNADYAQLPSSEALTGPSSTLPSSDAPTGVDPNDPSAYAATAGFNRFTGRFQADLNASENHNDENKSKRQMNAFFDVDAAANSHDGRSLRAERQSKKLTKEEVKAFREKTKKKKEEKRRAWLRD